MKLTDLNTRYGMKTVLITGASSGIGQSLAQDYANLGYQVIACGRSEQRLKSLTQHNENIEPLIFDINDDNQIHHASLALPSLDIVILNAGDCQYMDDVLSFDAKKFEQVIQTNLIATAKLLQRLVCLIQPHGQLVLMGSSVSFLPLPRAQAYGASKAGLAYLAESLAIDLHRHHIKVSLISPGFIDTPLTAKNTFAMPFMLSSKDASMRIIKGIRREKAHISFPKRLIWPMKVLSFLPRTWWRAMAQLITQNPTGAVSQ